MFAIIGASGNTGAAVASRLMQAGRKVRVHVRSEEKGQRWAERGAEVLLGRLEDAGTLARFLSGVEGLNLLVPPDPHSRDLVSTSRAFIDRMAAGIAAARVPHVVLLSSVGAQHADGTGPIKILHQAEAALSGSRATFLRAAYFMENFGMTLPAVLHQSVLPSFGDPAIPFPMVAVDDIAAQAAAAQLVELTGRNRLPNAGTTNCRVARYALRRRRFDAPVTPKQIRSTPKFQRQQSPLRLAR